MHMPAGKAKKHKLRHNAAITSVLVPLAFLLLVLVYYWNLGQANWTVGVKFAAAVAILWIAGIAIVRVNALKESYGGLFVFGGRKGIGIIEDLAGGRARFWEFFAQVGLVMSFGALSYFVFRKQIGRKALALGLVLTAVMFFVVWPFIALALNFIAIPGHTISVQSVQFQLPALDWITALELVSIFAGGFALFIIVLLAYPAATIVYGILSFTSSAVVTHTVNTAILGNQLPGIEPVVPGVSVPLVAGLLAFAVVLIVHEFAHGVLFTTYRRKVKRTGLLMLGVVPVGGFADAGEKAFKSLSKERQNKVLVAGVMANYAFAFVFFIITYLMMAYVVPGLYANSVVVSGTAIGSPAYNVIMPGSAITSWNGHPITDLGSLEAAAGSDAPGEFISVGTSNGNYSVMANSTGKIGVYVQQEQVPAVGGLYFSVAGFLYQFAVLAFALNLLVAVMNLLPLPIGLDGWRIYRNTIRSKAAMRAIEIFVAAAFVILILPWIWYFLGI